jgi:hypothetical protein
MASLDNIFYINTASINNLAGTGSLLGTLIGSASWASSSISSSFLNGNATGSLWGTASYSVSSSYAGTASVLIGSINNATYAVSASWASSSISSTSASYASASTSASYYKMTPAIKSGKLINTAFVGSPLTCSYTFSSSYPNTNYSVAIIGGDNRAWTLEQVSASSFTISTNSTVALTDYVYWISMATGESS